MIKTEPVNIFPPEVDLDDHEALEAQARRVGVEVVSIVNAPEASYDVVVRGPQDAVDRWLEEVGWGASAGYAWRVTDGVYWTPS